MEVCLHDVGDANPSFGGRIEVNVDVTPGIDHRGDPRRVVRDQGG
jgi:hypothetical protein